MAFTLVVVVAFVGLAIARTAMDQGAFELAELERRIAVEETQNQHLRLEVSRLESPSRIGPMAEEMGLVYPDDRVLVVVRGVTGPGPDEDPRWAAIDRYAAAAPAMEGPNAPAAETPETP
jgi:cell division protein FtsL